MIWVFGVVAGCLIAEFLFGSLVGKCFRGPRVKFETRAKTVRACIECHTELAADGHRCCDTCLRKRMDRLHQHLDNFHSPRCRG